MIAYPSRELRSHSGTARKFAGFALCRMCGKPKAVRPLTRHHLVPQSWFRYQDGHVKALMSATANLIPLCRLCHDLVDNSDDLWERVEARKMLRRSLTQQEIAFAIQVRGQSWLDIAYPP